MYKIVIVEDELIAAEYLKNILQLNNFKVLDIIDNGLDALSKIPSLNPDIVLMDIMLKDHISGSEVAVSLKYTAPDVAIVFLTAYSENEMLNYAMKSNCYGYLMKPYEEQSIINSLKVILTRINEQKSAQEYDVPLTIISESLYFHMEQKRLFRNGIEVPLGTKPLAILETLCKYPNVTVSAEELSLNIWGEIKDRGILRTQISRLKKEIGEDIIENIKGLGYKIICK